MFVHVDVPEYKELETQTINNQRWYITPENNKYPSITTILGITMSKEKQERLNDWRLMLGSKKAAKETKRCADRGTAVHEMAEHYLKNVEDPIGKHIPEHSKMFNQIKVYLNKINNIRALEVPLYSDTLRLAGRVDCIGEYNGILSVIDFKTSNNNKDDKMVYDYKLQATAYALMYHEMFDVQIDNIVILIAVEKGLMPIIFKDSVDEYIEPLVERINTFYNKRKNNGVSVR